MSDLARLGSEVTSSPSGKTGPMDDAATAPTRTPTPAEAACPIPQPLLPPAELTPELTEMVAKGVDERWVRQLGHAPEILVAWTKAYWPFLFGGRIESRTKEVARLRIAQLNGCHY